jgi:hypothetical protein
VDGHRFGHYHAGSYDTQQQFRFLKKKVSLGSPVLQQAGKKEKENEKGWWLGNLSLEKNQL